MTFELLLNLIMATNLILSFTFFPIFLLFLSFSFLRLSLRFDAVGKTALKSKSLLVSSVESRKIEKDFKSRSMSFNVLTPIQNANLNFKNEVG